MFARFRRWLWIAAVAAAAGSCQDYPFETRDELRVEAVDIREIIRPQRPADIIFLVDNSGTMVDELTFLRNNIRDFVDALSASQNDFRIGFLTPDMECNVPDRDCASPGGTSAACCATPPALCQERDLDSDGKLDASECDGGRFRAADSVDRFFDRPSAAEQEAWLQRVDDTLLTLGCDGSAYEASLEVVRRAAVCSLSRAQRVTRGLRIPDPATPGEFIDSCPDEAVEELNAGFIRDDADLVVLIISDEDDCSFLSNAPFKKLTVNTNATEQAQKLCSPNECYAYHGTALDSDIDGIMDWADSSPAVIATDRVFRCGGLARVVNPPLPEDVDTFVDDLIKVKENKVDQIFVGAIVGGLSNLGTGPSQFASAACFMDPNRAVGATISPGPSDQCGCAAASTSEIFCEVTAALGQGSTASPTLQPQAICGSSTPQPGFVGCAAMMGGRLVRFADEVATRRLANGAEAGVLVDSICQIDYSASLQQLVGIIVPQACYQLEHPGFDPTALQVKLNGEVLPQVFPPTNQPGWRIGSGDDQICLNGRNLLVGDRFEIFLVTSN